MEERAEAERFNAELDRMLAGGMPEALTPELELAGRLCAMEPETRLQAVLRKRLLSKKPGVQLQLRVALAAAAVALCMAYPMSRFLRQPQVEVPIPERTSPPVPPETLAPSGSIPAGLAELSMRRMKGSGKGESPFVTVRGKRISDKSVQWDLESVSIVLERKTIRPEDLVVKASEREEWGEWEVASCE